MNKTPQVLTHVFSNIVIDFHLDYQRYKSHMVLLWPKSTLPGWYGGRDKSSVSTSSSVWYSSKTPLTHA